MYKSTMKVHVEGQGDIELYTIGFTAKALKKSVETLRAWERQRIIPRPMYYKGNPKKGGVRLYHPKEVDTMKSVLRKLGKQPKKEVIQKAMWAALKETRLEILNGSTETNGRKNNDDRST